ncbi:MAG: hypothetical protein RBU30_15860 [Polyangia bacterium]|nr:hypothetical protein [Polyangia bacterium]
MAFQTTSAARFGLLLVVLCLLFGGSAQASARQYRIARYLERNGQLVLLASLREFFDARLQNELTKGFQKVIMVEARVYRSGQDEPVSVVVRTYKVIYDLWASAFGITVDDPSGTKQLRVNTLEQAVKRIAEMELPLGPLSRFPRGSLDRGPLFYTDILMQFAPLPRGFLTKIRRWLRNPQGSGSRGGSPLGSRFSLFVNPRISSALKEWRFRTQRFYRP